MCSEMCVYLLSGSDQTSVVCTVMYNLKRHMESVCVFDLLMQAKKKYYDTELENLEKQQKQMIEKMELEHAVSLREESKRIRLEQERALHRFQDQMKQRKKEVRIRDGHQNRSYGTSSELRAHSGPGTETEVRTYR